jgi:hypothetical protein
MQRMTTRPGNDRDRHMTLSLGQAAKEVGLDKSTLSRAIKRGKLSAQRTDRGGYEIDPAELFRVFPPASQKPRINPPLDIPTDTLLETRELRIKLEAAELRLRDKDDEIRDLRRRLDAESEERRRLTLMLLAPPQPLHPKEHQNTPDHEVARQPVPPPSVPQATTPLAPSKIRRVWSWIFGKS